MAAWRNGYFFYRQNAEQDSNSWWYAVRENAMLWRNGGMMQKSQRNVGMYLPIIRAIQVFF